VTILSIVVIHEDIDLNSIEVTLTDCSVVRWTKVCVPKNIVRQAVT
jgi:hypothetical protein